MGPGGRGVSPKTQGRGVSPKTQRTDRGWIRAGLDEPGHLRVAPRRRPGVGPAAKAVEGVVVGADRDEDEVALRLAH